MAVRNEVVPVDLELGYLLLHRLRLIYRGIGGRQKVERVERVRAACCTVGRHAGRIICCCEDHRYGNKAADGLAMLRITLSLHHGARRSRERHPFAQFPSLLLLPTTRKKQFE